LTSAQQRVANATRCATSALALALALALQGLVEAGKVRHIGLCNETPYGVNKFLEHAQWDGMPKIAR
jgi:aryl-alcohol dehydrogenase-like predicted oxidoreductase